MAQHDYVIDNQSAPLARADINAALQAIVTQNAGASAPATTYADMFWYDTANNQIKKRNEANSAWITLGTINESTGKFDPNASFTAVEQGGGPSQSTNKVNIGWNAIGMFMSVDGVSLGRIVTNTDATGASGDRQSTQMFSPGNAPLYACRAWVNFNGTGTVASRASGNISSITDNGVGNYTLSFIIPMVDANYVVSGSVTASFGGASLGTLFRTTTGVQISTSYYNGSFDPDQVHVAIFR